MSTPSYPSPLRICKFASQSVPGAPEHFLQIGKYNTLSLDVSINTLLLQINKCIADVQLNEQRVGLRRLFSNLLFAAKGYISTSAQLAGWFCTWT